MDNNIIIYKELNTEVEKLWKKIQNEAEITFFQTYEYNFEILKVIPEKSKLNPIIVCIFENNTLKALIPFELKKKISNYLCWLNQDKIDFIIPLIKKDFNLDIFTIEKIFELILQKFPSIDGIFLDKQIEKIKNFENPFVKLLKNKFYSHVYKIKLPKTYKEYEDQVLKKSFSTQNKRKKKMLKNSGLLKFKSANNFYEKNKLLDILFSNKKVYKFGVQKKPFNDNDKLFYKNLVNNKDINTHLSYLKINENFLSIHLGIIFRDTYNYLIISNIDSPYNRLSPGRILVYYLIRFCIKKKIIFFDFLLGDENYKKNWSNKNSSTFYFMKMIKVKFFLNFKIIRRIFNNILINIKFIK